MSEDDGDPRSGAISEPTARIGRLLNALRETVGLRALRPDASAEFRRQIAKTGLKRLSRTQAAEWAQTVGGIQISEEQIQRIENGRRRMPSDKLLSGLLRAYGSSEEEVEAVLSDPHLRGLSGVNPHLIAQWRMRGLALAEFGPLVQDALKVGDSGSVWVEVEKASSPGFRDDELTLIVHDQEVDPPAAFRKIAQDASRENDEKIREGVRGWSDNSTLCLSAITDKLADTAEERRSITCHFLRSWYRYNVIAKQEGAARFRVEALHAATAPLKPTPYLASGVGICINLICDGGKSVVIGHRSDDETFRKGELDVAVVEGIRPKGDMIDGRIQLASVARRALMEEMGLHKVAPDGDVEKILKRLCIFELGCDLEYYQWNFLSFAEVDLPFDRIYEGWQKAKDRKENQTIHCFDNDRAELLKLATTRPIWSSGLACALRTYDYL